MPGWLSKATTLLGGKKREPDLPEPFSVPCSCGNRVEGLRQPRPQVARCNRCGDRLFVLPKDAYPRPAPPPAPKIDREKPADPESRDRRKTVPREVDSSPAARVGKMFRRSEKPDREDQQTPREPKPTLRERTRLSLRRTMERQRAFFTPFRLLLLAIFGVIFLTGYWGWKVRRAEHAATIVQEVTEQADEAASKGDFVAAAENYAEAWKAHQILQRDDAEARRVHQAMLESSAAGRLMPLSLIDSLDEAQKKRKEGESGWETALDARYLNFWLIIDSTISRSERADGSPCTRIDCPLVLDDTPLSIETDAEVFDRLGRNDEPTRVIFGAQLSGFRFVSSEVPGWVVTLNGSTLFPWSNEATYTSLGLMGTGPDAQEATRKILTVQSKDLGVDP